jgi:hypothetical protein
MKKIGLCGHSVYVQAIRGCCRGCYNKYQRSVLSGETTWEALEQEGKVAKAKPRNWRFDFRSRSK